MKKEIKQKISGNNNIQIAGDLSIKIERIIQKSEVVYDQDEHITDAQAVEIKNRVTKIAQSRAGETKFNNKPPFGLVYATLYEKYKITKYTLLKKDQYEDAIKWLDKQIAIYRPKLKNIDEEQYRKDMFKSLNTRANQLGINIYEYAEWVLSLKTPITSLKELSNTRLEKLKSRLFSVRKKDG